MPAHVAVSNAVDSPSHSPRSFAIDDAIGLRTKAIIGRSQITGRNYASLRKSKISTHSITFQLIAETFVRFGKPATPIPACGRNSQPTTMVAISARRGVSVAKSSSAIGVIARSAIVTLVLMGSTFATIFLGLTFLATTIGVVPDLHEQETLNSLITRSIVGNGPYWWFVQVATAVLLLLAANTGFTGFPRLASVLANDRFMPRQFAFRGERLGFSVGIVSLALVAALVLWSFEGSVTELIPLYTVGVFLAFTLSQSGLVHSVRGVGFVLRDEAAC